jgi:hypothetical protein
MLSVRACQTILLTAALSLAPAHASHIHRSPTSGHAKVSKKAKAASKKIHGQRQIDPDRAREIQSALIKENYLSGEPSGQWDAHSEQAMQKYQADHGWQTRITPDSRALIKLGLGPGAAATTQTASETPVPHASVSGGSDTPGSNSANTLATAHAISN